MATILFDVFPLSLTCSLHSIAWMGVIRSSCLTISRATHHKHSLCYESTIKMMTRKNELVDSPKTFSFVCLFDIFFISFVINWLWLRRFRVLVRWAVQISYPYWKKNTVIFFPLHSRKKNHQKKKLYKISACTQEYILLLVVKKNIIRADKV